MLPALIVLVLLDGGVGVLLEVEVRLVVVEHVEEDEVAVGVAVDAVEAQEHLVVVAVGHGVGRHFEFVFHWLVVHVGKR